MKFLTAVKHRYELFQNITLNEKRFRESSEKHFTRGDCLPILKILQGNQKNHFFHFLTSWKHFYNLTIFQGYPWNIFETEIRGMFFVYSGNIALWLLEFAKRSSFVIVKSYTFNTKTNFSSSIFLKIFSFKMFLKCSLDIWNFATLKEYSTNIPGILCASWEVILIITKKQVIFLQIFIFLV